MSDDDARCVDCGDVCDPAVYHCSPCWSALVKGAFTAAGSDLPSPPPAGSKLCRTCGVTTRLKNSAGPICRACFLSSRSGGPVVPIGQGRALPTPGVGGAPSAGSPDIGGLTCADCGAIWWRHDGGAIWPTCWDCRAPGPPTRGLLGKPCRACGRGTSTHDSAGPMCLDCSRAAWAQPPGPPICDCGAAKARTTHARWCSTTTTKGEKEA